MSVDFGQQLFQGFPVRMVLEVQLAGEAILHELCRGLGCLGFQQSHMKAVVTAVDPVQGRLHGGRWHEQAQAVPADSPFNGATPVTFFGFDFHQFCHERQNAFVQVQVLGQFAAEFLVTSVDVGPGPGLDAVDFFGDFRQGFIELTVTKTQVEQEFVLSVRKFGQFGQL